MFSFKCWSCHFKTIADVHFGSHDLPNSRTWFFSLIFYFFLNSLSRKLTSVEVNEWANPFKICTSPLIQRDGLTPAMAQIYLRVRTHQHRVQPTHASRLDDQLRTEMDKARGGGGERGRKTRAKRKCSPLRKKRSPRGECSRGLLNDGCRRRPSGMNTLLTYQYLCKLIPQRFSSPKCKINPTEMLGNDVLPLVLGCSMISINSPGALGA